MSRCNTYYSTLYKRKQNISERFSTYDADAGAGYGIIDASSRLKGSNSISGNRETKDEMFLEQTFSPKDAPYCPNDLVWATEDGELRTLIKQRLEGGLLTFTKGFLLMKRPIFLVIRLMMLKWLSRI